jgi:hypothetical protein
MLLYIYSGLTSCQLKHHQAIHSILCCAYNHSYICDFYNLHNIYLRRLKLISYVNTLVKFEKREGLPRVPVHVQSLREYDIEERTAIEDSQRN